MLWVEFIVSAGVIVFAGTRLTVHADILSDRYNIHKAWIGVVLLGLVTSLPEAITSITAVVSFRAVDLAVGNILGSNVINPMVIVILDFVYRQESVTNKINADKSHVTSAVFAVLLSALVLWEIFMGPRMQFADIGPIGTGGLLLAVVYFAGVKILASLGRERQSEETRRRVSDPSGVPMKKVCAFLLINALLVIAAAVWLTNAADRLAAATGLGQVFFGSIFLALVTSLPEIVVSVAAVKIDSLHLAVGNIFGSNMVNIFIIFLCEIFYAKGSILAAVSASHMLTVVLSIVLVSIVLIGMNVRKRKIWGVGIDSLLMVLVFLIGTGMMYRIR